mgnify:CR=1 FL=1
MRIDIKVPSVGESVTEALLAEWYQPDGALIQKGELVFVIETDKVTLEVEAEAAGRLEILVAEGETVAIGTVVGRIDTDAAEALEAPAEAAEATTPQPAPTPEPAPSTPPAPAAPSEAPPLSPAVRRLVAAKRIDPAQIQGTGPDGRITKGDVILFLESQTAATMPSAAMPPAEATAALQSAGLVGQVRIVAVAEPFDPFVRGQVGSGRAPQIELDTTKQGPVVPHVGREQIGIVAAARRGDDPAVVPGGKDDGRDHTAARARTERRLHGIVGDIVWGRYGQLVAGAVDQRLEHLGHGGVAHRRSGADHLCRGLSRRRDRAWNDSRPSARQTAARNSLGTHLQTPRQGRSQHQDPSLRRPSLYRRDRRPEGGVPGR